MAVPCRHLRIVVRYDANLPQGGHGSSTRADRIFTDSGLKWRKPEGELCAQ